MNTKELMQATGITRAATISEYIKRGVIQPLRWGKDYDFGEQEVTQILKYRTSDKSHSTSSMKFEAVSVKLDKLTLMVESILSMLSNGNFAQQSYTAPAATTPTSTLQKFETPNYELQTPQPKPLAANTTPTPKKPSDNKNLTLIYHDEPLEYTVYCQTSEQDATNHSDLHAPLTYSKEHFQRLYTFNGTQILPFGKIRESINAFTERALGMSLTGVAGGCLGARERTPDEPYFDEHYSLHPLTTARCGNEFIGELKQREPVYTYEQATQAMLKYRRTLDNLNVTVELGYPDFETCLMAFYHFVNSKLEILKQEKPGNQYGDDPLHNMFTRKESKNFGKTIFDIVPLYHEYLELVHEPRYFKPTKPKHGENRPLAVDNNNAQRFPDSWEANRYLTTNGKYTFPDNAIAEMRAATRKMLDLQSVNMTPEGDVLYKEAHDYHGKLAREMMAFTTYYGIDTETDTGEE